jgi:hypothetical protein
MSEQLNQQLIEIKEKLRMRQKLWGILAGTKQSLNEEKSRLKRLEMELRK